MEEKGIEPLYSPGVTRSASPFSHSSAFFLLEKKKAFFLKKGYLSGTVALAKS